MNDISSTNQQICERCLRIDFVNALFVSADEATCDLCNLLSNAALSSSISESEAQDFEIRAFSYLQNGIGVRHTLPGA
ncbi:hypothetical protein COL940_001529 [Colletotrichum noveboracense]|nr:hypothetical protein COL940_001529 [Colletotrichum noveboracense]